MSVAKNMTVLTVTGRFIFERGPMLRPKRCDWCKRVLRKDDDLLYVTRRVEIFDTQTGQDLSNRSENYVFNSILCRNQYFFGF